MSCKDWNSSGVLKNIGGGTVIKWNSPLLEEGRLSGHFGDGARERFKE